MSFNPSDDRWIMTYNKWEGFWISRIGLAPGFIEFDAWGPGDPEKTTFMVMNVLLDFKKLSKRFYSNRLGVKKKYYLVSVNLFLYKMKKWEAFSSSFFKTAECCSFPLLKDKQTNLICLSSFRLHSLHILCSSQLMINLHHSLRGCLPYSTSLISNLVANFYRPGFETEFNQTEFNFYRPSFETELPPH